jgi:proteasome lid subunit RPN8/RPN11
VSALDSIAAHARRSYPAECCGVLVGTTDAIVEAVPSPNLADDPHRRFLIDPCVHFDAIRDARARGLTVVGFYHSHPASEPRPSTTDLAEASYPDHWYLIVRPMTEGCVARLFKLEGPGFVEHDFERSAG